MLTSAYKNLGQRFRGGVAMLVALVFSPRTRRQGVEEITYSPVQEWMTDSLDMAVQRPTSTHFGAIFLSSVDICDMGSVCPAAF